MLEENFVEWSNAHNLRIPKLLRTSTNKLVFLALFYPKGLKMIPGVMQV